MRTSKVSIGSNHQRKTSECSLFSLQLPLMFNTIVPSLSKLKDLLKSRSSLLSRKSNSQDNHRDIKKNSTRFLRSLAVSRNCLNRNLITVLKRSKLRQKSVISKTSTWITTLQKNSLKINSCYFKTRFLFEPKRMRWSLNKPMLRKPSNKKTLWKSGWKMQRVWLATIWTNSKGIERSRKRINFIS